MITWVIPIFTICLLLGFIKLPSIQFFILFSIALFGAVTISYLIELIVGILTFYTTSSWGLQCFKQAIMSFFSGALIPLELMPVWLQNIADIMPFKSIIYFPISIFLENLSIHEIVNGFIFQCIWIVILAILSGILYKRAIRKVTIAGG